MPKVLLVEDDHALATMVSDALELEGLIVEIVADGEEGLNRLQHYGYDIVVLDWQLPRMEGIEILRRYRSIRGSVPVLMLTGRGQLPDKEAGFTSGADDYMVKPFHIKELTLRIKALLRRPAVFEGDEIKFENVLIDKANRSVRVEGALVQILPKEFEILQFLARYPGQLFSQEELLNKLWPNDSDATTTALRSAVKRLRKRLSAAQATCTIRAVYGLGYKLEPCAARPDSDHDGEKTKQL